MDKRVLQYIAEKNKLQLSNETVYVLSSFNIF